jgi:hypothetical protein
MATTSLTPTAVSDDEVTVETIPMSYDEYLDRNDKEAGRRGEWVDGEVIPFTSTSTSTRWRECRSTGSSSRGRAERASTCSCAALTAGTLPWSRQAKGGSSPRFYRDFAEAAWLTASELPPAGRLGTAMAESTDSL